MDAQHLRPGNPPHDIRRFASLGSLPCVDLEYPVRERTHQHQLIKLGNAIRAARKASGLSQEDLALEAEIDYSTMGEIERGQRNATLIKVMRIATVLNQSMADLFSGAEI